MEAHSLANRDEPLPTLAAAPVDSSASSATFGENSSSNDNTHMGTRNFSGRLFDTLIQQILPQQTTDSDDGTRDQSSATSAARPNFSLPLMSNNFRRFNARIGVVFVFQSRVIRLLSWRAPTQTLAFLAVFTICCLEPYLLLTAPIFASIFYIIVPSYLSRHPAPPDSHPTERFAMQGPASAPATVIKPAPEMSKDFFRNMRDLQNCMEDFSVVHDRLVAFIAPLTNFSDEKASSTIFLLMLLLGTMTFIGAAVVPWRIIMLLGGWTAVCSSHPSAPLLWNKIDKAALTDRTARIGVRMWKSAKADIMLDEAPEVKEVEVFELERHRDSRWQAWLFSTSPYDPLSPRRISGERPRGARFFEDVEPPRGWRWKEKKWSLDLLSREWVEQRMITSVEVETEDERWVYDIMPNDDSREQRSPSVAPRSVGMTLNATPDPSHRAPACMSPEDSRSSDRISLYTTDSMNWTGGNLSRHSKKQDSKTTIGIQRQHFARARSKCDVGCGPSLAALQPDLTQAKSPSGLRQTRLEEFEGTAAVAARLASLVSRPQQPRDEVVISTDELPLHLWSPPTLSIGRMSTQKAASLLREQDSLSVLRRRLLSQRDWIGLHPYPSKTARLVGNEAHQRRKRKDDEVYVSRMTTRVPPRMHVPSIRDRRGHQSLAASTDLLGGRSKDIHIAIGDDVASSRSLSSTTISVSAPHPNTFESMYTTCVDRSGDSAKSIGQDISLRIDEADSKRSDRSYPGSEVDLQGTSDLRSNGSDRLPSVEAVQTRSSPQTQQAQHILTQLLIPSPEDASSNNLQELSSRKIVNPSNLTMYDSVVANQTSHSLTNNARQGRHLVSGALSEMVYDPSAVKSNDPGQQRTSQLGAPASHENPAVHITEADPDAAWKQFVFGEPWSPRIEGFTLLRGQQGNRNSQTCLQSRLSTSLEANMSGERPDADDGSMIGLADDEQTLTEARGTSQCRSRRGSAAKSSPGDDPLDYCSNAATQGLASRGNADDSARVPHLGDIRVYTEPRVVASSSSDELSRPGLALVSCGSLEHRSMLKGRGPALTRLSGSHRQYKASKKSKRRWKEEILSKTRPELLVASDMAGS